MIDPNFVRFAIAEKTAQLDIADDEKKTIITLEINLLARVLELELQSLLGCIDNEV